MSYALWLYKEITNDTGKKTRLEIEKRDYTGSSIEITALSGDIVLSMDTSSPTEPIAKSTLEFSIIDTGQVTYSDFFTPDATLYRVKVYDVDGSTQTARWTGFITPDSFGEPLEYRGAINLTARDNLGYLNDLEFDYNSSTDEQYVSIRTLIDAAMAKISQGSTAGGMSVTWNVAKQASTAADGTFDSIEDAVVSTYLMLGDTWGSAVEELLKGIGCQLRFIDNNAFAVYDIETLSTSTTFTQQAVRFLNRSGYREIQAAWKRGIFEQDYGLLSEVTLKHPTGYSGRVSYTSHIWHSTEDTIFLRTDAAGWTVSRGTSASPRTDWGIVDPSDVVETENRDKDSIYIPYSSESDDDNRKLMYIQKGISVPQTELPMTVTFEISQRPFLSPYRPSGSPSDPIDGLTYLSLYSYAEHRMLYDLVLVGDDGNTYHCRESWILESELTDDWMSVELPTNPERLTNTVECEMLTMPTSGTLYIRIYAPWLRYVTVYGAQPHTATADLCFRVSSITVSPDDETISGRARQGTVNTLHNITGSDNYTFGQVPSNSYDILFYKGGLYKNDARHTPYSYFKRNSTDTARDNLLDLIARETIQYHKKSFNILSGTVQVTDRTASMKFATITYGGKRYLPLAAALSLLENAMRVTQMLEVEDYTEEAGITFSDYSGKSSTGGTSSGGSSSSGGTSITAHGQLTGRDADDQHPISSVTNLQDTLDEKVTSEDVTEIRVVSSAPSTYETGVLYIIV